MQEPGTFLYHAPCEECGSTDAKAVYSNGTSYCFACRTSKREGVSNDEVRRGRGKRVEGLIQGEIKPLSKRGITEETCQKFGYAQGIHKGTPVQIAPYYKGGSLVGQHLRTPDKEFPWLGESKGLDLFGQHLWQSGGKRIVITEGEIDAMSVAQAFNLRWPAVSLPNGAQNAVKTLKPHIEWLESFEEICLAFDNDEPGREAVQEAAQLFTPGKVKVVNWSPFKDANDFLKAGKVKEITDHIWQAKAWRPDGILPANELTLEDLMKKEEIFSYDTGYPELDRLTRGLRKAELTMLTAGSGIGKSTLAREFYFRFLTQHNLRVGIIALEENVKKTAKGLIALDNNVPMGELILNPDLLTREQYEKSYQNIINSGRVFLYDHFGSLDSDNLVAKLRYLAVACDVDFIILDHVSIVVSGIEDGDERRIIDNLMTSLRSLVENTGVGVVAICHLKVPEGKATAHEEGGRVTMNHLRGSGALKQLSDTIIALERNQQDEERSDYTQLRILKNRLFGDVGVADELFYNKQTGRLVLAEAAPKEDSFGFTSAPSPNGPAEDDDDVPF